jgi:hypothetical protein
MRLELRSILPALAILLAVAGGMSPTPASALVIAQNDSMDWSTLDTNPTQQIACPCFCAYECFGATFEAPADMSLNYIYMLYGATAPVDMYLDFYLFQGPDAFTPGQVWVDGNGVESIGIFLPIQTNGSELIEVQVAQSQVTPPQVLAGDDFSVAFCYNYDKESQTVMEPNQGHGPIHDGNVDGDQSGTNWIQGLNGFPKKIDDPCSIPQSTLAWFASPTSGDWAIRVTDQPVDWLNPPGGDDDDAGQDDDDIADDDDVGDDDDATEGPIVLSVTPNRAFEGADTAVAIQGTGFDESASASIGGYPMTNVTFVSSERIDATVPRAVPSSATPYEITVVTTNGSNTLPGAFTVDRDGDEPGQRDCSDCASFAPARVGPYVLAFFGIAAARRRRSSPFVGR